MITANDCVLLLDVLKTQGIDVDKVESELMTKGATRKVVKFIKDNNSLSIFDFYEKLRKSYNDNRSKLYINIVKEDVTNVKEAPITLSSYVLQTLLFSKQVEDDDMFLRQARYNDACDCLSEYGKSGNIIPCIRLLQTIKSEIKALEELKEI